MPFFISWDNKRSETEFRGIISYEELREVGNRHYGDIRFNDITSLILDFCPAEEPMISTDQVKIFASLDSITYAYKPILKMAFVANSQAWRQLISDYINFCRQFNSYWSYEIFHSIDDARHWCQ